MIRIYASDPAYQEIADLAETIARLVNVQCWFNLYGMPEIERVVELQEALKLFEELSH